MPTMQEIEKLARDFSGRHRHLRSVLMDLEAQISECKAKAMPMVRKAVDGARLSREACYAAVQGAQPLFVRPKSVVIDGVKVGYRKASGSITFDDPDAVVRRIRKHLPEQADVLIVTREVPSKDALANLTAAELKRISVSVVNDSDVPFVKPVDTDVDKLAAALLGDEAE